MASEDLQVLENCIQNIPAVDTNQYLWPKMNKPTWCCLRDLFQFYHRGEINYKFDGTVTCGTSCFQKLLTAVAQV